MGVIDEIRQMQDENKSEQEIVRTFMKRGYQEDQIKEVMSQTKIKDAVSGADAERDNARAPPEPAQVQEQEQVSKFNDMQPSMLAAEQTTDQNQGQPQNYGQPVYAQQPAQEYSQDQQQYQDYQQYQPTSAMSSDTISEIAEQVVAEKLSTIRNALEKTLDLKTTFGARIESLDQRLQKIEKIIDRLQLSILQKVGEFGTNLEDIKTELIETQKSFKAVSSKKKSE